VAGGLGGGCGSLQDEDSEDEWHLLLPPAELFGEQQLNPAPKPEETEALLEGSMAQLRSGDYALAARGFSHVLQSEPEHSAALIGLQQASKGIQLGITYVCLFSRPCTD
jgi:hypothetical protein